MAQLAVKSPSDKSLRGMAFLTLNWCYNSMGVMQNSIMELFIFLKIYPNIDTVVSTTTTLNRDMRTGRLKTLN
jgi:hypothetical protein